MIRTRVHGGQLRDDVFWTQHSCSSQGLSAALAAEDQACRHASMDGGRDHENPSQAAGRGCGPWLVKDAPADCPTPMHVCSALTVFSGLF